MGSAGRAGPVADQFPPGIRERRSRLTVSRIATNCSITEYLVKMVICSKNEASNKLEVPACKLELNKFSYKK